MIELTRLNGHPLYVNPDLIKFVEQAPDTVLTLISGEKVVVRETPDQILDNIVHFRRQLAMPLESSRETFIDPLVPDPLTPERGSENLPGREADHFPGTEI